MQRHLKQSRTSDGGLNQAQASLWRTFECPCPAQMVAPTGNRIHVEAGMVENVEVRSRTRGFSELVCKCQAGVRGDAHPNHLLNVGREEVLRSLPAESARNQKIYSCLNAPLQKWPHQRAAKLFHWHSNAFVVQNRQTTGAKWLRSHIFEFSPSLQAQWQLLDRAQKIQNGARRLRRGFARVEIPCVGL